MPETATTERAEIPLLISLADMTRLFPVAKQTVYRWRIARNGKPPMLPEPDRVIARTPVWREEVVQEFAASLGYKLDAKELRKIRKEQGAD